MNAFCRRQGQEATNSFTEMGTGALGGPRLKRSCSLLGGFSRDFREFKPLGQCSPNRGRVGEFPPKQESLLPGQSTGLTPHKRTRLWVSVPPTYARSTLRGTVAGTPSRAQVPSSSPGHSALCGSGRPAGKCGPRDNSWSSGWQDKRPAARTKPQGPRKPGKISKGLSKLPKRRILVGGPALRLPGPASWPKTGQQCL